jgi:hypothetical protein
MSLTLLGVDPALHKKATQIATEQARTEFDDVWDLVELGEVAARPPSSWSRSAGSSAAACRINCTKEKRLSKVVIFAK